LNLSFVVELPSKFSHFSVQNQDFLMLSLNCTKCGWYSTGLFAGQIFTECQSSDWSTLFQLYVAIQTGYFENLSSFKK
jgi:hypothetical protein